MKNCLHWGRGSEAGEGCLSSDVLSILDPKPSHLQPGRAEDTDKTEDP